MESAAIEPKLRRYVRMLRKNDDLASFISSVNKSGEAYIFGGAPRDVAFCDARVVNDLDIIVSGDFEVDGALARYGVVKRNNFGGFKLRVGNFDVDIWDLRKSYAFRFDCESYVSVRNLLRTVCFSTDAIAVSLKDGRVIRDSVFDKSLLARRLDFVVPPSEFDAIVAVRICRLILKLKLEPTPSVASYFIGCYEAFGAWGLIDSESRWGSNRLLNEIAIQQVRSEIRHAIDLAYREISRQINEADSS